MTDVSPHRLQAARLGALWNRLSSQHVALGCSCTMTGISVTLEDFEPDIADYLWAESGRFGQRDVETFLLAPGPIESQHQPIRGILQRLESGQASDAVSDWLLTRMTKTIESYAKLHGPEPQALLLGGAKAWRTSYRE